MKKVLDKKNLLIAVLLSATLGLAPFVPEPHIWGKLKWVAGGAEGMKLMDWWDLIMHSAPFVWLLAILVFNFVLPKQKSKRIAE